MLATKGSKAYEVDDAPPRFLLGNLGEAGVANLGLPPSMVAPLLPALCSRRSRYLRGTKLNKEKKGHITRNKHETHVTIVG